MPFFSFLFLFTKGAAISSLHSTQVMYTKYAGLESESDILVPKFVSHALYSDPHIRVKLEV